MGVETALLAAGLASTGPTGILFASPAIATFASAVPTIGSILGGISTISSFMGGMESNQAAEQQAEYAKAQAAMQGKESARQAVSAASVEKERYEDVVRRQKLAYMASGVSLEGSPLLVMESTRQKGMSNVDEILEAGAAGRTAAEFEGRIVSSKLKTAGRQEFMKGISTGVSGLTTMAKGS